MAEQEPVADRFLPPEPRPSAFGARLRWGLTLLALVVLIAVAYQAYAWFAGHAAQRQAAFAAIGEEPDGVAVPPPVEVQATSVDAPGAGPGDAPVAAVNPGAITDPDQRRSVCGYLAAEVERLGYEFKQPLPPPVIDRIATEIAQLHQQASGCAAGAAQSSSPAPTRTERTPTQ